MPGAPPTEETREASTLVLSTQCPVPTVQHSVPSAQHSALSAQQSQSVNNQICVITSDMSFYSSLLICSVYG